MPCSRHRGTMPLPRGQVRRARGAPQVEQSPSPPLRARDIVICDNLSVHKNASTCVAQGPALPWRRTAQNCASCPPGRQTSTRLKSIAGSLERMAFARSYSPGSRSSQEAPPRAAPIPYAMPSHRRLQGSPQRTARDTSVMRNMREVGRDVFCVYVAQNGHR